MPWLKDSHTPKLAAKLLSWFINSELSEEFLGDMEEVYEERRERRGAWYACFMYWFDTFHLIFGFYSKRIPRTQSNTVMIKHNLKIVGRNLYREASYSLINITGLSLGITCCIILVLYLKSELTHDQHFSKHERIYRVSSQLNSGENTNLFAETSYALGPLMAAESAQIESFVRFSMNNKGYSVFDYQGNAVRWNDVAMTDPNIFEVFSHDIVFGNPETALTQPQSMAVSQTFARTYFGDENPVGKTIKGELTDFVITLVFADLPDNTHLKYDVLIAYQELSSSRFKPVDDNDSRWSLWYTRSDYTYLLMPQGYDHKAFDHISDPFFEKYMADHPDRYNSKVDFLLEPLDEIHLSSQAQRDRPHGNRFYIAGFTGIAIFVLLVACINYMNLSTARFSKRTKGIVIPKVLGAQRHQLIFQLLTESFVFVLIALVLGLGLSYVVINYTALSDLLNKSLQLDSLFQPEALVVLVAGAVIMSAASGLYPAITLSRFSLIRSTKTNTTEVRQGLVFVQFLVSICVISCTILMYNQMRFVKEKSLGFEKENKLVLTVQGAGSIEKIPVLINELKQHSNVVDATVSLNQLGRVTSFEQAEIENNEGVFVSQSYNWFYIDQDFVNTMGIELISGRNFDETIPTDANHAILVNETLVKKMGWKEPLGKRLRYQAGEEASYVVGVMKDFHFQGLQHEVESMIFWLPAPEDFNSDYWTSRNKKLVTRMLTVNISGNNVPETLGYIEDKWKAFDNEHPFEFQFLDDSLDRQYSADIKQMSLIGIFAGLCILISCLGLFGLTAFTIEQRTKEIGIRKTLGASSVQIVGLLLKNVFVIVAIAAVVASAMSYIIMEQWLQGFYYKDNINLIAFVLAAASAFVIAFLTMSTQSFKTAQANPVKALRHE